MRYLFVVLLAFFFAGSTSTQPLEDCTHYSPQVLNGWQASRDTRVAAYAQTCRAISIDAYVSEQTSNGFPAQDSHYWIETYQTHLGRIDQPGVATGNYANADNDDSPANRLGRRRECSSRAGVSCQAQCGFDQACYYQCQGGNAWRCNQ